MTEGGNCEACGLRELLEELGQRIDAGARVTSERLTLIEVRLGAVEEAGAERWGRVAQLADGLNALQSAQLQAGGREVEATRATGRLEARLAAVVAAVEGHAETAGEASRVAQAAAARAGRGKTAQAFLQAAGVLLGAALATAAQQCTPPRAHGASLPPATATHGGR